ncbi:MAG: PAS domain S-box protein, partial [Desulfobulbaceae bacterium]|nr:PAS domain S-box protein [Desulfobulbaceae bacterium]
MTDKPGFSEMQEKIRDLEKRLSQQQAEQERLRQEKDWLSQILYEISIPTFAINDKHILTHVNKAYENLTGISADEILGTNRQWLPFYASERPTMADLMADGASEEEVAGYYSGKSHKSAVNRNGYEAERLFSNLRTGEKWIFFTASPLIDNEGNIIGAVETLQDITEQKRAKEKLQRSESLMRTLLDFIPYPIAVFTLDGRVFYLNPAFTETFGWTFAELDGKTIPYTPPDIQEETGAMIQKLLKEKIILRHETRRLTKDGRVLDVIMRAGIYSEAQGEHGGELVILRDITKEKRIARNNEAILRIST